METHLNPRACEASLKKFEELTKGRVDAGAFFAALRVFKETEARAVETRTLPPLPYPAERAGKGGL